MDERACACASMDEVAKRPPAFDAVAKLVAKQRAAALGRPGTRDAGLKALHAALHVTSADAALEHFGISRQRFSEWTRLLNGAASGNYASTARRKQQSALVPEDKLLVTAEWITQHTPAIKSIDIGGLTYSPDGLQASRLLRARVESAIDGELLTTEVEVHYSSCALESDAAETTRRKKHRGREEAALRHLDSISGFEERHRKQQRQNNARQDQSELVAWLDAVLDRVQRHVLYDPDEAAREATAQQQQRIRAYLPLVHESMLCTMQLQVNGRPRPLWTCPAGCLSNDACARASFRLQCVPSHRQVTEQRWQGCQAHLSRDDWWAARKSTEPSDAELHQIREAFLRHWDGFSSPGLWFNPEQFYWVTAATASSRSRAPPEWLGVRRGQEADKDHDIDQFGPIYDVGRAACARRRCDGCCYCIGVELPEPYLEVVSFMTSNLLPGHPGKLHLVANVDYGCPLQRCQESDSIRAHHLETPYSGILPEPPMLCILGLRRKWLTVNAIRTWLQKLPSELEFHQRLDGYGDGRGITLPGSIRLHVDADELADWVDQLHEHCSIYVQICETNSLECKLLPHEKSRMEAHVAAQTALQIQVRRDQEAARARGEKPVRLPRLGVPPRPDCADKIRFVW